MTRVFFSCYFPLAVLFTPLTLQAQTIADKLSGSSPQKNELTPELQRDLKQVNSLLQEKRNELKELHDSAQALYALQADVDQYRDLLQKIELVKIEITAIQEKWRQEGSSALNAGSYALWHQPETTLSDVIIDYGSSSYVYFIPSQVASLKLSLDSNLPIPRESWNEMLELILKENGVGIRQLNPFLRELYLLKEDFSRVTLVTNQLQDLRAIESDRRVAFMLSPNATEVKRVWFFLNKFINQKTTFLHSFGNDILIVGQVGEIKELIKLYDFAIAHHSSRSQLLVPVKRADPEELAKVINTLFDQLKEEAPPVKDNKSQVTLTATAKGDTRGEASIFQVIPLTKIAPAVFLVGTEEEIRKAVKIIRDIETQVGGSKEKIIHTYQVLHSNAEELAKVLDKMYALMIKTGAPLPGEIEAQNGKQPGGTSQLQRSLQDNKVLQIAPMQQLPPTLEQVYGDAYYYKGNPVIGPNIIEPLMPAKPKSKEPDRDNFIVDPKTGTIMMVIESEALPRLQELIAKIDVPKRMVQIDVLLFEKRMNQGANSGLNLLTLGSKASQKHGTGATFNDLGPDLKLPGGIFNFFISRMEMDSIPAFDAIYTFLISQEDIQLNANPSVLTLNEVAALIAIQEELSINTGQYAIETATGQAALKDSYTRAEYGITIKVTPTIHMQSEEGPEGNYITLDSELTFDTVSPSINDRPDVIRRKVKNQVRIPDGQSVILGGLRRKDATDTKASIPFLGEIPGIGKLFSNNTTRVNNTEMFIILTPKIVSDPALDLEKIKYNAMRRRPGDVPEFLCALQEARDWEKRQLLRGTMTMLFGLPVDQCMCVPGEYDGS